MKDQLLIIAQQEDYQGLISADLKEKYQLQFEGTTQAALSQINTKANTLLSLVDLDYLQALEVITSIKSSLKEKNIPIVALSSKMVDESEYDYVLLKPILAIELELAVLKTLNKARLSSIRKISDKIKELTNSSDDSYPKH